MGCEKSVRLCKPSMLHETSDGSFSTFELVHLLGAIQWKAVDIHLNLYTSLVQYNERQLIFSIKIIMLKTENQTKVYIYFEDSLETSPKTKRKQPPTWTYPPTHSQTQIRNVNGDCICSKKCWDNQRPKINK